VIAIVIMDCYRLSYTGAFVISGAFSPIVIQIIALNGAADPNTMIILLPSCVGAGLSILCNWSARSKGTKHWGFLILLTVIETISAKLTFHGMIDAGSTIFTVVYCSVTMFAALFGLVFLNRQLNCPQWTGIGIIMAGLGILMYGANDDGFEVKRGILLILLGAMIHSFSYVIVEFMLVVAPDPIAPEMLCSLLGGIGFVCNVFWQLVYTVPRFDNLILGEIKANKGDMWVIVESYLLLVVASGVNSTSFYYLLGTMGSASTGNTLHI
jgi:drug/metabolite transporter (DMT)-like permease